MYIFLELIRNNYKYIRSHILTNGLGKDSGQYLWDDGEDDQCGKSTSKFLIHARNKLR